MIKILKKKCTNKSDLAALANKLHERMEHRFGRFESSEHLKMSTLLNPRFKRKDLMSELEHVIKMMIDDTHAATDKNYTETDTTKERKKESCLWDDYDEGEDETSTEVAMSAADMEMKYYSETRRLDRNSNILLWWKSQSHVLPLLSKLAMKYLATPATSVPCERVFFPKQAKSFPKDDLILKRKM